MSTKKKPVYDFSGGGDTLLGGGVPESGEVAAVAAGMPQTEEIDINLLRPYHNHMFGLYEGARLDEMLSSVRESGVLVPILVRETEGAYEILAGHNRVNAARLCGLDTVPARVLRDISDDKADLIVTESNLCQRSFGDLRHSERAMALKVRYDALRSQGKRRELIDEVDELLRDGDEAASEQRYSQKYAGRTDVMVAGEFHTSPATISRYIKLAGASRAVLDLVDAGTIPFLAGVYLTYLDDIYQAAVAELAQEEGIRVTVKNADALRSASSLEGDRIREILTGVLTVKKKAPPAAKIRPKVYRAYLPEDMPVKDVERIIEKALQFCHENNVMEDWLEDGEI